VFEPTRELKDAAFTMYSYKDAKKTPVN
jgi:hypothetical protein